MAGVMLMNLFFNDLNFSRLIFLCTAVVLVTSGVMLHALFQPEELEVGISVYGREPYQVTSGAETVEELLLEQGIEKSPADRVFPTRYHSLEEDLIIEIKKVFPLEERIAGEGLHKHNQYMVSVAELMELSAEGITYGIGSWYGPGFHGRTTASGEPFSQYAHTAAHKELPLGTEVKVTFPETSKSILVRINDRGPYVDDRIIDLSQQAADEIGLKPYGVGKVKVEVVEEAD